MVKLDLTQDSKQAYFAAYLNMAQNNAYNALKNIIDKMSLSSYYESKNKNGDIVKNRIDADTCFKAEVLQDEYIAKTFDKEPKRKEEFKSRLLKSFPFLVPMISTNGFYNWDENGKLYYAKGGTDEQREDKGTVIHENAILENNKLEIIVYYLKKTLEVLNFYRNNASHTQPMSDAEKNDPVTIDMLEDTAITLDGVFKEGCSKIKDRFSLSGNVQNGANLQVIQDFRVERKSYLKKNPKTGKPSQKIDKRTKKPMVNFKTGKPIYETITVAYPNYNSHHCFYINDDNYTLSRQGLVYLICQFIEKKYASEFFQQLPDFYKEINNCKANKETKEKYCMYLREIYSCYRIILPKRHTNPYEDKNILALDMLNEIAKCPKELYDIISKNNQNKFETLTADIIPGKENELLDKLSDDEKDKFFDKTNNCFKDKLALYNYVPEVLKANYFITERGLLRRYEDRFPELVMRWIDEYNMLGNLRFQVFYGRYHQLSELHENGIKKCADGKYRERWMTKELTAFGKITDIEDLRTGKKKGWDGHTLIQEIHDDKNLAPWITDIYSQYNIKENLIAIKAVDNPALQSFNGKDFKGIKNEAPDFLLNVYDLPGLVFLSLLRDSPDAAKQVILKYGKNYNNLFDDIENDKLPMEWESFEKAKEHILKEYGLKWSDIPKRITDSLFPLDQRGMRVEKHRNGDEMVPYGTKRKSFLESSQERIRQEITHTERLINWLKSKKEEQKRSKTKERKVLPGRIGSFLAEDIVMLMNIAPESKGKTKPTGLNYDIMQAYLATFAYEYQFGELKRMLQKLDKADSKHPFLDRVLNLKPNNVIEMFDFYLKQRLAWMNQISHWSLSQLKRVSFLHYGKSKWTPNMKKYIHNLREKNPAIVLPRGIFAKEIQEILLKAKNNHIDENRLSDNNNVTHLLKLYVEANKDSFQEFYDYARTYEVYAKMDKTVYKNPKANDPTIYRPKTEYNKDLFEREYAKYLEGIKKVNKKLKDKDFDGIRAKMNHMYSLSEKTASAIHRYSVQDYLLFMIVKKILSIKDIEKFKLSEVKPNADQGILSEIQTITLPILDKQVEWTFKIKDFSRVFKITNDRRIPMLFKMLTETKLSASDLNDELGYYDQAQIAVFKHTLDLEREAKKIVEIKEAVESVAEGDDHKKFSALINAIKTKLGINTKEYDVLNTIRNAFAHGEYPKITLGNPSIKNIAKTISDKYENLCSELIKKIKAI